MVSLCTPACPSLGKIREKMEGLMPESSITPLPHALFRLMQGLGWLCFPALAVSHRTWSFAVLQTPRGTLGRSFGPRWYFVIPAKHGGCLGQLHSWLPAPPHWRCGLGAQAWSHISMSPVLDQHCTQGHKMHQLRCLCSSPSETPKATHSQCCVG